MPITIRYGAELLGLTMSCLAISAPPLIRMTRLIRVPDGSVGGKDLYARKMLRCDWLVRNADTAFSS